MKARHAAAFALVGWYLMIPLTRHPEAPLAARGESLRQLEGSPEWIGSNTMWRMAMGTRQSLKAQGIP
jgi:hypothetical protein